MKIGRPAASVATLVNPLLPADAFALPPIAALALLLASPGFTAPNIATLLASNRGKTSFGRQIETSGFSTRMIEADSTGKYSRTGTTADETTADETSAPLASSLICSAACAHATALIASAI